MASHPLFRGEALEHHRRGGARGDVLQLTPRTLFWTHWMLLFALAGALYYAFVGQVDEYASGPAVVRLTGLHEVTAPRPGVVSGVEVTPGQRVERGQLLVRMHSATEVSELESVERELEDQLAKLLRDPADLVAREAIVGLRSRRDLARAKLGRQELRAPADGTVGDVRVREGQLVEPGMPVVTLLDESGGGRVTAMLPGRYRPLLQPGMELRFVADGFSRVVHSLEIERVGDQIVGATEAARYLGRDLGGALTLRDPVVFVDARLSQLEFDAEDGRYRFHHGMHGQAESAVRRDSIAFTFVPGLKRVFDHVW